MRAITATGIYTRKLEEAIRVGDDSMIKTEKGKEYFVSIDFKSDRVVISMESVSSYWERVFSVFHDKGDYVRHEGVRHIPMPIKAFLSELGMRGVQ